MLTVRVKPLQKRLKIKLFNPLFLFIHTIKLKNHIFMWFFCASVTRRFSSSSKKEIVNMKKFLLFIFLLAYAEYLTAQTNTSTNFSAADAMVFDSIIQKGIFNGSVLIIQNGKTVFEQHNGLANKEQSISNSNSLRYNIGSIGKILTAVLILKLVEEQILDLEKKVVKYLPGTPLKNAEQITIRQLLNMTSGLGDYFNTQGFVESETHTNQSIYKYIVQSKLICDTPGLRMHYSNAGFIVAGAILERFYQKPFQQIVWEQLLAPAGFLPEANGFAVGYEKKGESWLKAVNGNNPLSWSAASGLFLSSTELQRIIQHVITGKYVTKPSLQRMWYKEAHPEFDPPFVHYGLGWMVEEPGNVQMLGHNGGVEGFQSAFRYLPQDDLYISVLSNHGNGADEVFMGMILYWLRKKGVSI